ncbi:Rieske 2Fe-2S domain-containing protein [Streptomyces sp. BE20]|nr:Rieske 2Fe-2S domain-containing protein [Streptomyces sp. BE20]
MRPGTVTTKRLMGEDVVLYRTRSGRIRVVRPYCPHLGAHLGCGGRVDDEDIVCPFHHFAFDPDGNVARTGPGYTGKPVREGLTILPSEEVNGGVFAWSGPSQPTLPWNIPQLLNPRSSRSKFVVVDVHSHPQEICENTVDIGHTRALHGFSDAWMPRPPIADKHSYSVALQLSRRFPPFGSLKADVEVNLYGLGFLHVLLRVPRIGLEMDAVLAPRPVDPWRLHLTVGVGVLFTPPSCIDPQDC